MATGAQQGRFTKKRDRGSHAGARLESVLLEPREGGWGAMHNGRFPKE